MRKTLLATVAAAALAVPLFGAVAVAPANAAVGENIIYNGDFSITNPDGSLVGATTDFALADNTIQGNHYAVVDEPLSMWDEGTYVVGYNPNAYHVLWVNQPSDNPKMIVNGFTEGDNQIVWSQSQPGLVCPAGNQVTYDFSATVANILPLDQYNNGGAAITVNINGVDVASVNLTTNDPSNPVVLSGNSVPALETMTLQIKNSSTVKIGNDFSLDDISLKQVGGCQAPVAAQFPAPAAPTCEAAGSFDLGLLGDRGDYDLAIDPAYHGVGDYTLSATAHSGFFLSGDASRAIHVLGAIGNQSTDPNAPCYVAPPKIGGLTLGYYKNHTVTNASWQAVRTAYPALFGSYTTSWTGANGGLTILSASGSTNNGKDMLRAQFLAVSLRALGTPAYGTQKVAVPAGTGIDGGTTVTVNKFLADVNAGLGTLTTKAQLTSVQNVLMLISQDDPSVLFV